RRTVLPGGVRVLTETMPGLRSATFGCWVGVGSRDEAEGHLGSTHFLEHLLFKGTTRRSAMDIASAFDAVGGEANAVTGKEHTCYYARVLDEDLALAVDVLSDMITSATLSDEDVESERGVILEELAMNDDDPGDVVHERFAELVLGDHPLGRPIGGTVDTIEAVGTKDIVEHYRRHYQAPGLVLTAAGGLDHDELCARVMAELGRAGWPTEGGGTPLARRPLTDGVSGAPSGRVLVVRRQIEQANVVLGCTGLTATDPRRYVMSVLNAVLGGGMSSRLFQEIREKRGLAYSVYSFASGHSDSGYFGLYAGCTPGKVDEVVTLLRSGLEELAVDGISDDELARAHGQICGGLVLGLEDSGSRMSRLGKAELVHGEFASLDESLSRVRAVTGEQVQKLAVELAARPRSLAVVGPFDIDRTFPAVGE
ncbi:MAG TPA: pitrilysin family protein, partial [Kineosporiaceae bacterium]|nr:pitrilysin family protein [Kineosporiaceae bacterium]